MGKKILPQSGEELRKVAVKRMKTREVASILPLSKEERIDTMAQLLEADFNKLSKPELAYLKEVMHLLYVEAVEDIERAREEEQSPLDSCAVGVVDALAKGITATDKQMDPQTWNELHGLRKDGRGYKPGPKKKTRPNLLTIKPGEYGTDEQKKEYEPVHKMPHEDEASYAIRRELEIEMHRTLQQPPRLVGRRVNRNPHHKHLNKVVRNTYNPRQNEKD